MSWEIELCPFNWTSFLHVTADALHVCLSPHRRLCQRLCCLLLYICGKESAYNAEDAGDEVQSLGREDPLGEGMTSHSSILA